MATLAMRIIRLIKTLEQFRELIGRDVAMGISYANLSRTTLPRTFDAYLSAFFRVLDSVVHQDSQELTQPLFISKHR